jgi:hypothetical protein
MGDSRHNRKGAGHHHSTRNMGRTKDMKITNSSDHGKGRTPGGQWIEEME